MDKHQEMQKIVSLLKTALPKDWDGQECILYMKNHGCTNWKQMEWPGWYFQFMCERILSQNNFMQIPGPAYGNVIFDGLRNIPWDFKAHATNTASRGKVPTNGYAEVVRAIKDYGMVGFIIASGTAYYDDCTCTFKRWHDDLKGERSAYERERIQRGASSRRRKCSFSLDSIDFVFLDETSLPYCGSFQKGMQNSNGTARNAKVMSNLHDNRLEIYHCRFSDLPL